MIVYPDDNYDSWIDEDAAGTYFETRLNADPWDACSNREAALITAFHSLNELDLTVDPTDSATLDALKRAQLGQAHRRPVFNASWMGELFSPIGG